MVYQRSKPAVLAPNRQCFFPLGAPHCREPRYKTGLTCDLQSTVTWSVLVAEVLICRQDNSLCNICVQTSTGNHRIAIMLVFLPCEVSSAVHIYWDGNVMQSNNSLLNIFYWFVWRAQACSSAFSAARVDKATGFAGPWQTVCCQYSEGKAMPTCFPAFCGQSKLSSQTTSNVSSCQHFGFVRTRCARSTLVTNKSISDLSCYSDFHSLYSLTSFPEIFFFVTQAGWSGWPGWR